ncbi:MAG: hypothetical protein REI11_05935, partial [Patulibacter sp.]|nr:hypothetical protein [Patulibacter sp.]
LWSTSRLDDDGGLLLDETIDAFGVDLAEIRVARALPSGFEVILARGAALTFRGEPATVEALAARVEAAPAH